MTPQERELVAELFDRLVALESAPREPDAERIIAEGLRRAPHAIYPLVQTVLVQDEALKAADARIRELEAAAGGQATDQGRGERGGFLDGMRGSVIGRREAPRWGSVPTVQPAAAPGGPAGAGAPMQPMPPMAPSAFGGGSSFLGTAAAAAAGMVGGSLLLGGIRSMLGGHQQGAATGAFDQPNAGSAGHDASPWGGSQDTGGLGHQAGLDDIGRGQPAGTGDVDSQDRAGLVDTAASDGTSDDSDVDPGDDAPDSDTDYA